MSEIILHHFDISPFAEKIRVALGIKGLAWQSVQIPLVMPKPDLTCLTGGYRKTPVMQIGADIYCDTQRIATELDARYDGTALLPAGSEALCQCLASWSDTALFRPGAGLSMGTNPEVPEDILQDRFAFFDFLDRDQLPGQLPNFFAQFRAGLQRLEDMLSDGRPFLLGETPTWADAACYAPVWMCRGNIRGAAELLAPLSRLRAWEASIKELGHGGRGELSAQDAHAVARQSQTAGEAELSEDRLPTLAAGSRVSVSADDYGQDAVLGTLLRLTQRDIAIQRSDEAVGEVTVHFPRSGYRVEAA